MKREDILKQFRKDVARHEMHVIRDDGLDRHIRFIKPDSNTYYFDLITWKGHLCYTGDMGTFVFWRVDDMFTFFRSKDITRVDVRYWAEKVIAEDMPTGVMEYSPEKFRDEVEHWFATYSEDMDEEEREILHDRLADEVLGYANDGEYAAMEAAMNFEYQDGLFLCNFWESNPRVFTYRFLWCCLALPWAISVYDEAKKAAES